MLKVNNAKKSDKRFFFWHTVKRTNNNRGHNTLRCTFCGKAEPNFNLEHIKNLLLECGAGILNVSAIKNKFLESLYSTRQQDSRLSDGWCSEGEELIKFLMNRTQSLYRKDLIYSWELANEGNINLLCIYVKYFHVEFISSAVLVSYLDHAEE